MPPPPRMRRSSSRDLRSASPSAVSARGEMARSTSCRASVSGGFREKTVTSAGTVARAGRGCLRGSPRRRGSCRRTSPRCRCEGVCVAGSMSHLTTGVSEGQASSMPSPPQQRLKLVEKRAAIPDRPRREPRVRGRRLPGARRPRRRSIRRMHAKRPVRDVRDAEVLAARQQVLDADRDHRAERDLERPAAEVEVAGAADARMEIDPIAADPHRVVEQLGPSGRSGCAMCCSSTVNSARSRLDSRTYGASARPSGVPPTTSPRRRRPG